MRWTNAVIERLRARVSRNRGRLPSSRCIESAPEHPAFILILLLMRASLGLIVHFDRVRF
jgi:hypothetical protein